MMIILRKSIKNPYSIITSCYRVQALLVRFIIGNCSKLSAAWLLDNEIDCGCFETF